MKWINIALLLLLLNSCENNKIEQISFSKDDVKITYKGKQNNLIYTISSNDIILFTENIDVINGGVYSLPLLTKEFINNKVDTLAYLITQKGNFSINYTFKLGTTILADSVINYTHHHLKDTTSLIYAELLSDKFGTIKKNDYSEYEKRAKTFLVENNLKTNKTFVDKMACNIFLLLNHGRENRYKLSKAKIYNALPKTPITVKTNINAKYFYLVAVENENDIKEFVKNEIVNDFKQGNINTIDGDKQIQLNLTKLENSNNLLYIFTLGIDEDWNFNYQFVGGMILDNLAPNFSGYISMYDGVSHSTEKTPIFGEIKFKDYYIEYKEYYHINSFIYKVTWGDFSGNDYSGYPISLSVRFNKWGDFDHLILQGKKYYPKSNDIYQDRFVFEHRFPRLKIGDNFITIKFIDQVGNSSSKEINIRTQQTHNNNIDINSTIFNDIEINNNIYDNED